MSFSSKLWQLQNGDKNEGKCNICSNKIVRNSFYYDNFYEEEYFTIQYFKILCNVCYFSVNSPAANRLVLPSVDPPAYEEHIPSQQSIPSSQKPPYENFDHKLLNSSYVIIRYFHFNILAETKAPYKLICLVSDDLKYYLPVWNRLSGHFFDKYKETLVNQPIRSASRIRRATSPRAVTSINEGTYDAIQSKYIMKTSGMNKCIEELKLLSYHKYIDEIQQILERCFCLTAVAVISKYVQEVGLEFRIGVFKTLYNKILGEKETLKNKRYKVTYKAEDPNLIAELREMSRFYKVDSFL